MKVEEGSFPDHDSEMTTPTSPKKKLCLHVTHTPASACHHPSPITFVQGAGILKKKWGGVALEGWAP